MKGIISVNSDYQDFLDKKHNDYINTKLLSELMIKEGFDVKFVFPENMKQLYETNLKKYNEKFDPDFFFIRQIGENLWNLDISRKFLENVSKLDYKIVINQGKSALFDLKDEQKKINGIPFIKSYKINNKNDLYKIVENEEIIAKPIFGFGGSGVTYLKNKEDILNFDEKKINSYWFEKYIESDFEKRLIFLEEKILVCRGRPLEGEPAKQYSLKNIEAKPTQYEEDIVKKIINESKMTFGCVDFRFDKNTKQEYVLEINGPGVGLTNFDIGYDIRPNLIKYIKNKVI